MTNKAEQIAINIDVLDIKKIHDVITFLGVKWTDTSDNSERNPTIDDVKKMAIYCMNEALESEKKFFSIGGFESEVIDGLVDIKFIISQANPLFKLIGS